MNHAQLLEVHDGTPTPQAPAAARGATAAGTGPVVLITGASSGIGRCCAEYLHRRGFRVYGTSRRAPESSEAAASYRMIALDVTTDESVQAAVALILEREGRIDVVMNNAGDGIAGAVEDTSVEEAKRQFETNFFGALRVCRAVLPSMRARGAGLIVNVSSLGGLLGLPFQGLYSASKFALEGMTEALRMELRPFGVRAVLIEPGDFRTGFTAQRRPVEAAAGSVYAGHFGKALATMERDEAAGADPLAVARLLERLIATRAPRVRYKVGGFAQTFTIGLRKVLPQKLVEYLMMKLYGLS
ncbi:MAG TPA: SDR family oxidoreductase [Nevskia sp.]|nr:SDR family oxidoreductase [Nevskia sp.]